MRISARLRARDLLELTWSLAIDGDASEVTEDQGRMGQNWARAIEQLAGLLAAWLGLLGSLLCRVRYRVGRCRAGLRRILSI